MYCLPSSAYKKTLKCIQIQKSRYTYINLKLELVESALKIGIKGHYVVLFLWIFPEKQNECERCNFQVV